MAVRMMKLHHLSKSGAFNRMTSHDVLVASREFPGCKVGDVVEIAEAEGRGGGGGGGGPRLLANISGFKDDLPKGVIGVEQRYMDCRSICGLSLS